MPHIYRAIFAAPGTLGFSAAGLLGRLPIGMLAIGIVTMVSELTGAYGLAGALAATVALSSATLGPQVSRLVDRYGQRRVLRPAALVTVSSVAGVTASTVLGWPVWTLFACAAGAGCVPSLGAMIRSRWVAIYRERPRELHAAYAWESVMDEVCFIFGPVLAIGLSTAWFPQAGPLAAACFLLTGVFWLTAQRATEPPVHAPGTRARGTALRTPGVKVLVATGLALGAIFGSIDVVTVAFAEDQGRKAAASLLLAGYALGSCAAGAVFGLVHLGGAVHRRWLVGVCLVAAGMVPLQFVHSLPVLALALFLAGLSIAPTMITTVTLVERLVPRSQLTEGMTWTSAGVTVGMALGSAAGGRAVDAFGAEQAYAVPAAAGAGAVLVALLGFRRLAPARSQPSPPQAGAARQAAPQPPGPRSAPLAEAAPGTSADAQRAPDASGAR
ncbi:MFS transporter [Streptomyces sp. JJ66]|uniref:MFS transporter n=1 Tax=Streptomyces sp. JJ66 TaxID=2803843 RepID=UPI001C5941DB|nr:MFS transporter [Streptomyces sp. JJ66]MBW1600802.1 MFS transporter [Streptomyces sp. JJ66]